MEQKSRYEKGLEILNKINPNTTNISKDVFFTDLNRFEIESLSEAYAGVHTNLKTKELATVAVLSVMSDVKEHFRFHINGALNQGWTINELKEAFIEISIFAGFQRSHNAMQTLSEVLKERREAGLTDIEGPSTNNIVPEESRYAYGAKILSELDELQESRFQKGFGNFAPEMVNYIVAYGYGDVYSRTSLSHKNRQVVTLAALTAFNSPTQLAFHINVGLKVGLTVEELREIFIQMVFFTGVPASLSALSVLNEIQKQHQ
jgi:4-carboxymuconolactone decarboxylase